DVGPRSTVTRKAIENGLAGGTASGGSTSAVLHLLAIGGEAQVPLTIDDLDAIGRRTPLWADLQPGGRYSAVELGQAGGTAIVAKRLVDAKLAHGDAATVTRRTFAAEAARVREASGPGVLLPLAQPIQPAPGP